MNPIKKILKYLTIGLILYLLIITIVITIIMHKKSTINYDIDVNKKNDYIKLIDKPKDALDIRLNLMDKAEKTLDISYYNIDKSDPANVFLGKVLETAERGVKVRILINKITDSFVLSNKWKKEFLAAHPNIDLYYYGNFPLNFYKIQDNLHDKALIVDDDYLLTGGRNIGKKFFVEDDSVAYDLDLLIERKS